MRQLSGLSEEESSLDTPGFSHEGKPASQQALCSPSQGAQVSHGFLETRPSESTGFQDWKF